MANTCQTCHLYKASHQCLTCKMVFCLKCKLEFHLNYKNHEIEETKTEKDVLKLITGSFRSLYNKKHFSDIILNCQGVKFYAHKIVLSIFSDTLNKMFSSGLEETTKDEIKLICNTEPKVFELLLRYVYLQENLEIDWENAISLLTAANFYSIQGLVELCSISLQSLINEDNVCYLVITAQMNNTIDLKLKCLEFLIRNFEKAPIMDGFLKLDLSTMKDVIAYSASVNEQILFDSVYFWYKENLELSNIGTIFDHLDVKKIDMRSKTKIIDLVSDKPQSIPRRSIFFEVTLSEGDDFNYTIFPMLFTWKIPAMYLNLPKNESYESPKFWMRGSQWYMDIYPNGQNETTNNCHYLNLNDNDNCFVVKYKFYIEGISKSSLSKNNYQRNIFKEKGSYGWHGQRWENGTYKDALVDGCVILRLEVVFIQNL